MPGLTPVNSDKTSGGLMRMFTRKTNKLQPKFEMTGQSLRSTQRSCCTHIQCLGVACLALSVSR